MPQSVFEVAPELVPLLCSNLDDHESTPRVMVCMCLQVIFERLKGAFGEQSVSEVYPILIKRLDDSSDQVRLAICPTLESFFRCAPKRAYSSTCVGYMLDQLFVHLDDGDSQIQEAVKATILTVAKEIGSTTVLKKAEAAKDTHRSVTQLESLIAEIRGYEVIS